jgi:hypothetical protein
MEPPTSEAMVELRGLYAKENKTDAFIDYGDKFRFSMNDGDYKAPRSKTWLTSFDHGCCRRPTTRDIHDRLAQQIREDAACAFNNALVEHYTNVYTTMKRHPTKPWTWPASHRSPSTPAIAIPDGPRDA